MDDRLTPESDALPPLPESGVRVTDPHSRRPAAPAPGVVETPAGARAGQLALRLRGQARAGVVLRLCRCRGARPGRRDPRSGLRRGGPAGPACAGPSVSAAPAALRRCWHVPAARPAQKCGSPAPAGGQRQARAGKHSPWPGRDAQGAAASVIWDAKPMIDLQLPCLHDGGLGRAGPQACKEPCSTPLMLCESAG